MRRRCRNYRPSDSIGGTTLSHEPIYTLAPYATCRGPRPQSQYARPASYPPRNQNTPPTPLRPAQELVISRRAAHELKAAAARALDAAAGWRTEADAALRGEAVARSQAERELARSDPPHTHLGHPHPHPSTYPVLQLEQAAAAASGHRGDGGAARLAAAVAAPIRLLRRRLGHARAAARVPAAGTKAIARV